jgi:hypothetical protein
MRVITEEEAQKRRDYYHDNNIGWVARPKHEKDGFQRKGRFKKASNMNFALNVAVMVEEYLQQMMDVEIAASGSEYVDDEKLDEMYRQCLDRVLNEDDRVMAAGNVRMGELILIIDSDTRVVSTNHHDKLIPTDSDSSLLTVSCTVPPKCSSRLRLPSSNTRPV